MKMKESMSLGLRKDCEVFMVDLAARKANESFWQSPLKHHMFVEQQ